MAGADYRSCDVCGCKTFYDAELYYQAPDAEHNYEWWLHGVGDWAVICVECAKEYKTPVTKRGEIADLRAKLAGAERERDEAITSRDAMARSFGKWIKERPVAPHPTDQMNNLERFLWEDTKAEIQEWKQRYTEAKGLAAQLSDKYNGEPCAEIRWQQEREESAMNAYLMAQTAAEQCATLAAQSAALAKAREALEEAKAVLEHPYVAYGARAASVHSPRELVIKLQDALAAIDEVTKGSPT